jgi:hypothetical protein
LWWEIGQAHALPEAAKALEPRPFVFEADLNEVEEALAPPRFAKLVMILASTP